MEHLLLKVHSLFQTVVISAVEEGAEQGAKTVEELAISFYKYLAANAMNILYALLIFIIGRWVAGIAARLVEKSMEKAKIDATLYKFTRSIVYAVLLVFVIIAALDRVGFQVASFVAILGAAGLAVGLALQGSLANFASGVLLVIFKPFRVGDFVELAGTTGTVKEIHIFNTILTSPDNLQIILPNAQVTGGKITNYTVNGKRRVDLVIGVSYGDNLQKTRQVMLDAIATESKVLSEPAPTVAVSELADSSVNFVVRPWCKSADYWDVYFSVTEKVKDALDKNGITIPFPQRDVHMAGSKSA